MENNNKVTKIVIFIALVALLFIGYMYFFYNPDNTSTVIPHSAITSLQFEKPDFKIEGTDLSKIEVWAISAGTDVSESEYISFGSALLKTTKGENPQEWVLEAPQEPTLVTQIFAKGFDESGKEVGRVTLPLSGSTEIYNTIWSPVPEEDKALAVGETATFEDLSITLKRVTEDSRCPKDVNCVWAGRVVAEVDARTKTGSQTLKISSGEKPYEFSGYFIEIKTIAPLKSLEPLTAKDYKITFTLSKDVRL